MTRGVEDGGASRRQGHVPLESARAAASCGRLGELGLRRHGRRHAEEAERDVVDDRPRREDVLVRAVDLSRV